MRRAASVFFFVMLSLAAVGVAYWRSDSASSHASESEAHASGGEGPKSVQLSDQAILNLAVQSRAATPTSYWKALDLPGVVIDRPGVSDRGVVSPVAGVVTKIHAFPGDTIRPSAPLFTVRLISESLNLSQLELFKAARDIEISREQRERLMRASESGSLAGSRIIEIDNQLRRLEASVAAYRQDLQLRGLTSDLIDQIERGNFLSEFEVLAPPLSTSNANTFSLTKYAGPNGNDEFAYQLQSLEVKLGQQLQAGEVLCYLADHRSLLIEGRAFTDDLSAVQVAALNRFAVAVQFDRKDQMGWSDLDALQIQHVANTIDSETRTFAFYLPLANEWRTYTQDSRTRQLWRFRPGDRVKLRVPIEKLENVLVVPAAAVARDGFNAYVFRHNGNQFDRLAVHILTEDREHVVLANDGSIPAGVYLAQSAAASINRILKSQSASSDSKVHVHADGTVHAAH